MDATEDLMKLFGSQGGGTENFQPPQSTSEPHSDPQSSPMVKPEKKKGDIAVGNAKVRLAMNVLTQAMMTFGSDSEEGEKVMSALRSLSNNFGGDMDHNLVPAQILDLVRNEPMLQKGQPIQQAMQPQQGAQGNV